MCVQIDDEIKAKELQIQDLNVSIKEFVNDLEENDLNINYNKLTAFAQQGNRLHVDLYELNALKKKYFKE
jgi:hypothetical protein